MMGFILLFVIACGLCAYFQWRRRYMSLLDSLGYSISEAGLPGFKDFELVSQVKLTRPWYQISDSVVVTRCGFDSGRAPFSLPGHIVVGEVPSSGEHLMAITDELRRVYGQGYKATGVLHEETEYNLVTFAQGGDTEAFTAFVARWRKVVSIEVLDARIAVTCGPRAGDVVTAIEVVSAYREWKESMDGAHSA